MHGVHGDTAAHQAAEKHLEECWTWFFDQENEEPTIPEPETLAPFCGCQTCEIREILWAAQPFL